VYEAKDAAAFLAGTGLDVAAITPQIEGKFISAFVRGTKPGAATSSRALPTAKESCCGPDCGCSKT